MDIFDEVLDFVKGLEADEDAPMHRGITFSSERFLAREYPEENWRADSRRIIMYTDDGQHEDVGSLDNIIGAVINGMGVYVADRETYTEIERVPSLLEGVRTIREFEEEDKKDGTYTDGFYCLISRFNERWCEGSERY